MPEITRRRLAAAGLAAVGLGPAGLAQAQGGACILTPRSAEGPFYYDPGLDRADITEGLPGAKLRLLLQVVTAGDCRPVGGARVDVWHADALGRYSGYPAQGAAPRESFLRGLRHADAEGRVEFQTLWPGWYPGRTPHIHFKVWLGPRDVLTGQLYFPDAVSDRIYRSAAPYAARGRASTSNAEDGLLRRTGGEGALARIREAGDGHEASLLIGIGRR